MYSKQRYFSNLASLYSDSNELYDKSGGFSDLPDDVSTWLGQLRLLYGIPINYLVPDENMIPPESIRFFYLDANWIEAILDGAYSIGRDAVVEESMRSFMLDKSVLPIVSKEANIKSSGIRPKMLGLKSTQSESGVISGFLLRSCLVKDYPGLGVNAYPHGSTPSGEDPGTLLNILRMESLGPESDTLVCLIDGDAYRIDIHEAPEALHYGIDEYAISEQGEISGRKRVYPFSKSGEKSNYSVTMDMEHPKEVNMGKKNIFRTGGDSRTLNMSNLALEIHKAIDSPKIIDASEMGFEMTEGVGMVSFHNKTTEL